MTPIDFSGPPGESSNEPLMEESKDIGNSPATQKLKIKGGTSHIFTPIE
jgi:hypothetical protein